MEPPTPHSERGWILIGMAESCAAKGYEETTLADVRAAAGVSEEVFARSFAGKGECLGAAMESICEDAWRALDRVGAARMPWAAALRNGVVALLEVLAQRPAFAHVALIEAPHAGGRAAALAASNRGALLEFLDRGRAEAAVPEIPPSAAGGALVGAETLVRGRLLAGKAATLPALAPDVIYMLAVPFLGVGEASRLAATTTKRGRLRAVA